MGVVLIMIGGYWRWFWKCCVWLVYWVYIEIELLNYMIYRRFNEVVECFLYFWFFYGCLCICYVGWVFGLFWGYWKDILFNGGGLEFIKRYLCVGIGFWLGYEYDEEMCFWYGMVRDGCVDRDFI